MSYIDSVAQKCGYSDYFEKNLQYPPTGLLPLPGLSTEWDDGCDVWYDIFLAALQVNPAFNMYRITDTVSSPVSHALLSLMVSILL